MEKYMKKSKLSDNIGVMEVSKPTTPGVRTRAAKTLALKRLNSSASDSSLPNDSSCYLQLRRRRLEKPFSLIEPKQPPRDHKSSRVDSVNSVDSVPSAQSSNGDECFDNSVTPQVSCGENSLDFESRHRINRHSSLRRGLEPLAEDRSLEHRGYDFEFCVLPENGFTAEVLVEPVLVEPADSGDHSGGGSGSWSHKPEKTGSNSRYWVDEEGFSHTRTQARGRVVVSKAPQSSGELNDEVVDVFIDLETTEIDEYNALHLRRNIDEMLKSHFEAHSQKPWKSRDLTVYALQDLDRTILLNLHGGNLLVKQYKQRKAMCTPCKHIQVWTTKSILLELEMAIDIGRTCLDRKEAHQRDLPIVVITNDGNGIGRFAERLKNNGFSVITNLLPTGMNLTPMSINLSQDEFDAITTRAARLRREAIARRA